MGRFGSGPTNNGKPVDPGRLQVNTPSRPSSVLNDAILMAAQDLSHQSRESRKIIFVVSNGREYGSRASYEQVLKVLLTQNIAVYAIGVDSAALPGYRELGKLHIPTQGYTDILPKYANATGGDVLNEMSREIDRERLSADHASGAQPVHPGIQHHPEPIEQVS